jgi:tRNA(Ile)-lysidine synthetase-like protein
MHSSEGSAGDRAVGTAVSSRDSESSEATINRVRRAVAASLARTGLARSRRRIVVAVSGGADSLCLLDALVAVTPHAVSRLVVGHVDHQLRPASADDAAHVTRAAETYGLPCTVLTVDVPLLVASERRGIEEGARIGRYRALNGLAKAHSRAISAVVVTGHTADDMAETVLLHLLRGSGLGGLAGISEQERLPAGAFGDTDGSAGDTNTGAPPLTLVRPLLTVTRSETVNYCEARGLRWLTDESNTDPRMLRNRVRGHLLPVLQTYNPAIGRALTRTAATVSDDEAWLDLLVARLWRRLARSTCTDGTKATISLSAWHRQPVAAQRRLIRHFAEQIGYREIGFDAVERALRVSEADGPQRAELGGRLVVERLAGALAFARHGNVPAGEPATLRRPATLGRESNDGA